MTVSSLSWPMRVDHVRESASLPDPDARLQWRSFTGECKAASLLEYDAYERGALLHREGGYTSCLSEWPGQRDAGAPAGSASAPSRTGKCAEPRERE